MDEHNHALAALRYLISRLDARHLAGRPSPAAADPVARRRAPAGASRAAALARPLAERLDNEALWTRRPVSLELRTREIRNPKSG